MRDDVDVSVVMGVFNGAGELAATLESVLTQQGCKFEFIIVNDGSTDETGRMLAQAARRDTRLRVIHQTNAGLTRALTRGCELARGDYIARQDCGDVSLPGRLARQQAFLREHPDVVMVACAVRYVAPGGENLYVARRAGNDLHVGLAELEVTRIQGPPHHGATMFRRSSYLQAGGYRPIFTVAQDIDLWLRLHELGLCIGLADIGYRARTAPGSITASRRAEQFRFAALAIECARRRNRGLTDEPLLDLPTSRPPGGKRLSARLENARLFYFIGSCLRASDPAAARRYYWQAFREYPLLIKSLIRFALG